MDTFFILECDALEDKKMFFRKEEDAESFIKQLHLLEEDFHLIETPFIDPDEVELYAEFKLLDKKDLGLTLKLNKIVVGEEKDYISYDEEKKETEGIFYILLDEKRLMEIEVISRYNSMS